MGLEVWQLRSLQHDLYDRSERQLGKDDDQILERLQFVDKRYSQYPPAEVQV